MADKSHQEVETAPDPEEDNLDDLDDVLDSFQATKITDPKPTSPTASGPGRPPSSDTSAPAPASSSSGSGGSKDAPSSISPDDFAKDLQASMATLMSELDQNPTMQQEFEKMMQELIAAGAAPTDKEAAEHVEAAANATPALPSEAAPKIAPATAAAGGKKAPPSEDKFQDTIRRTMERMQASGDAATAASTSGAAKGEDAMFEQMMASLLEGGGAGGAGGEGDFNAMLMNMMAQLTHKDILYEPMRELREKFPAWMEAHEKDTKSEDLVRYREQQKLVGEIVGRFERSGYSDDNSEDRDYIVERMQAMQSQGSPPDDLVGDMAAAQEALGDLESGCPTQ